MTESITNTENERRNRIAEQREREVLASREAERLERERQRKEINEDPRTVAFRKSVDYDRFKAEAEAGERRRQEADERAAGGRRELEDHLRARGREYLALGGDPDGLDAMLAQWQQEFIGAKMEGRTPGDERRRALSTPVF